MGVVKVAKVAKVVGGVSGGGGVRVARGMGVVVEASSTTTISRDVAALVRI
ncbi:MAG: hypothetical protein ACJ8AG_10475 [Ktedonobacteraceae bacterium]